MAFWRRFSLVLLMALASLGAADDAQADATGEADLDADGGWARTPSAPAGGVVGNGNPTTCTEANLSLALNGGGTVTFNCGGPKSIVVSAAHTITAATTIAGGDVITLTGGGANRLFIVDPSASLTLAHIVLAHGRVNGGAGGSIYSRGGVWLDHARIHDSQGHSNDYGGAIVTFGPLTLTSSTLDHNQAGFGGAIYADNFYDTARVVVSDTTFSANDAVNLSSGKGGAILLSAGAQLTMTNGQVTSNSALQGGAIYQLADSNVSLFGPSNLTFTSNEAAWDGGALYNNGGTLYLQGVELLGNTTPTATVGLGYGGAIYSLGDLYLTYSYLAHNEGRFGGAVCACGANPTSDVIVNATTFQQNVAGSLGGGLYSNTGINIYVAESSFNGNWANNGGGLARINSSLHLWRTSLTYNTSADPLGGGGGLFLSTAPFTDHTIGGYVDLHDVTVSGNTAASGQGGGIYNSGLAQLYSLTLKDNSTGLVTASGGESRLRSAVLQNTGANCQGAAPVDDVFNFATDLSCAFVTSAQGTSLDPKLGALTSDGLLLPYFHLPAGDSPLVNHGPASASLCDLFDQRGLLRNDRCDIGAVEFRGVLPRLWLPLTRK